VDLLLFAGGDGTARDIAQAAGQRVPALGIPAGVKIHSGVFGASPQMAGALAARFIAGEPCALREAEVLDIDEDAFRAGTVSARLFGHLLVPRAASLVQEPKTSVRSDEATLRGIGRGVVAQMEPKTAYIIGPGTTTRAIMDHLGLRCSLLGVDVVRDKRLVCGDANEEQLLRFAAAGPSKIVVTPIGRQGHIFGRGNQQISQRVIALVGVSNIQVVASPEKLASLQGRPLLVDTDDPRVNASLRGYIRVITGLREEAIYRVA
jgi:predicted polyphosphate/ATP-dependent NAD kinase